MKHLASKKDRKKAIEFSCVAVEKKETFSVLILKIKQRVSRGRFKDDVREAFIYQQASLKKKQHEKKKALRSKSTFFTFHPSQHSWRFS